MNSEPKYIEPGKLRMGGDQLSRQLMPKTPTTTFHQNWCIPASKIIEFQPGFTFKNHRDRSLSYGRRADKVKACAKSLMLISQRPIQGTAAVAATRRGFRVWRGPGNRAGVRWRGRQNHTDQPNGAGFAGCSTVAMALFPVDGCAAPDTWSFAEAQYSRPDRRE